MICIREWAGWGRGSLLTSIQSDIWVGGPHETSKLGESTSSKCEVVLKNDILVKMKVLPCRLGSCNHAGFFEQLSEYGLWECVFRLYVYCVLTVSVEHEKHAMGLTENDLHLSTCNITQQFYGSHQSPTH